MNADGSDESRLVDMAAAKPDWSPDGQQIVFSSDENWTLSGVSENGVAEEGDCDLYVARVDAPDTVSKLANDARADAGPPRSPVGRKIAYRRDRGVNRDNHVIGAGFEER